MKKDTWKNVWELFNLVVFSLAEELRPPKVPLILVEISLIILTWKDIDSFNKHTSSITRASINWISKTYIVFRVTHKEWDYKEDVKLPKYNNLSKYNDPKFNSILLPWMCSLNGLFNDSAEDREKFTVASNYEYEETDSINSVHKVVFKSFMGNPVSFIFEYLDGYV